MRRRHVLWLTVLILVALLLWWSGLLGPSEDQCARDGPSGSDYALTRGEEPSTSQPGLVVALRNEPARAPRRMPSRPLDPIRGHVRDAVTGQAVAGARVEAELDARLPADGPSGGKSITSPGAGASSTDPEGGFQCGVVAGRAWRLRVTKGGYVDEVTEPTHAGATVVVELHPHVKQRGRVIGSLGAGVSGATLRFRVAHPQTGVAGWRPPVVAKATTDPDGLFQVGLGTHMRYQVTITHPAHSTRHLFFLSTPQEATFEMEGGALLRGRVGSASRRTPLAGAWIRSSLISVPRGRTGEDGAFLIQGGSGRLLYVGARGYATAIIEMEARTGEVEVWLEPSRLLRGTVEVPDGRSPRDLTVEVRGYSKALAPLEVHRCVTDEHGAFSIAEAGRSAAYVVTCRSQGLHGVLHAAPRASLNEIDLGLLRLFPADFLLRGFVTGPPPPKRVLLRLVPSIADAADRDPSIVRLLQSGGSRVVFADALGGFVIDGLAAGNYELTAKAEGWPDLRMDVVVTQYWSEGLILVMTGDHRIRGRLLDAKGRPLAGCYCSTGYGPGRTNAVTDAEGRFELRSSRPANTHVVEIRDIGMEPKVVLREKVLAGDEEHVFRAPGPADIQGSVALEFRWLSRGYTIEAHADGRVVATATGDELGFVLRGIKAQSVRLFAWRARANGEVIWEAEASGVAPGAREVILDRR